MKRRILSLATIASAFAAGCVTSGVLDGADEAAAETSTPAYMMVLGTVSDRKAFAEGYAAKLPALYEKYGGVYLAIGSGHEVLEGDPGFESYVVAEWPSRDAALAFWNSPEYEALRRARIDGGWGEFDVFLVDGLSVPTQVSPIIEEQTVEK